jgi:murein DD-endopeptidase MepM/ murein hydrolase activator NlpD
MPTKIRRRDHPDPNPEPTPEPVPTPAPMPEPPKPTKPADTLGDPTGIIGGDLHIAFGRGGPWADVNRHDPYHLKYGTKYGVPPSMLKAMEVIESGGQSIPNGNGFPNFGVMQLTHSWNGGPKTTWEAVAEKLGLPFKEPEGQIAVAAYVLGGHDGDAGTPEDIFLAKYYPIRGGLDVKGPDGHTQRQYLADMHELMRQIDAAAGGTTPAPKPKPKPVQDPIRVIVGGDYPPITYGFGADEGINSYRFGVGHGTTRSTQHTGYDVGVPHGTHLFTPVSGIVRCVGTRGTPDWGQSCGAYVDDMYHGPGNITILLDGRYRGSPVKLTLGHCSQAVVNPGDRVTAGQLVGYSGGSNGDHVHVETSINAPQLVDRSFNNYPDLPFFLVDPGPALREVMGGEPVISYADPVDIAQPDDQPPYVIAKAIRTTPVLQRGNPKSPKILPDLVAGDTFNVQHKVLGTDGRWYVVGRLRGRVAEADVEVVETVLP